MDNNSNLDADKTFLYPENLLEKTTIIGWTIRDIAVMACSGILAIIFVVSVGVFIPLVFTVVYAILSFTVDGLSVGQLCLVYARYILLEQQVFFWRDDNGK